MTEERGQYELARREQAVSADHLYGDDEQVAELAERVRMVAPWVRYKDGGSWREMTREEISLVVRRCMALGVDPLNQHEVQVWRDWKGVQFQLAYTLMTQFAQQICGGHAEPLYEELTDDQLLAEGLTSNDHAAYCYVPLDKDWDRVMALMDRGMSYEEAAKKFAARGLGVALAEEWNNKHFAPNGRSKLWKVRKRAYTDAIRMRFGVPSRSDIVELRRMRRDDGPTDRDLKPVAAHESRRHQLYKDEGDGGDVIEAEVAEVAEPAPVEEPADEVPADPEDGERVLKLLARYDELKGEAEGLGLSAPSIGSSLAPDAIIAAGKALKQRIEAARQETGDDGPDALTRLHAAIQERRDGWRNDGAADAPCSEAQAKLVAYATRVVFGDDADAKRHALLEALFSDQSSKSLTKAQASALIDLAATKDEATGEWGQAPTAALLREAANEVVGQEALL
jgi:hypothetical protein